MEKQIITLPGIDPNAKTYMIRGLINEAENHIFYVYFKKLDGTMREMICRRHVEKGIKGTSTYDVEKMDKKHQQMTVFDMVAYGFRKINLTEVKELKTDGMHYIFTNSKTKAVHDPFITLIQNLATLDTSLNNKLLTINIYIGGDKLNIDTHGLIPASNQKGEI